MLRSLVLTLLLPMATAQADAQGIAPVITPDGRFMLFDHGRFLPVDGEAPLQVQCAGDRLLFVDRSDALHVLEDGQVRLLDPGPGVVLPASDEVPAWTKDGALTVLGPRGAMTLTTAVGPFTLRDSLLVFHDRADRSLRVWWRARLLDIAGLDSTGERSTWSAGSNTVLFNDRARRTVNMLYRGTVQVLYDSTDMALVSAGGDLAAYWDDRRGVFRAWDRGDRHDLEPFRPRIFQAGDGLVGYVSNSGSLKVYRDGAAHTVLEHAPSEQWVEDSLLLFVDEGRLWVEQEGRPVMVEAYVPEQWTVRGSTITYLDLDRGLRQWKAGGRIVLAQGMATTRFTRWNDVVVWTGTDGVVRCWWRGRRYEL